MSSCCPPTAHAYLASDYTAKGTTVSTGAVELYVAPPPAGTPSASLLLCPDIWGWNGGRVRAVADGLAESGYLVVVGKFLATPCVRGGTDGDALPPDGAFDMEWIKNFPWEKQQPKVAAALEYCKERLSELEAPCRIGVVGFCYGAHLAIHAALSEPAVKAGAVFHPSIQLETYAFGGDTAALLEKVPVPFLLAPGGDDLGMWGEEADFSKALRASPAGAKCEWRPFPEMQHGWTCRGELSEPSVRRDVDAALQAGKDFLATHFSSEAVGTLKHLSVSAAC